MVSATLDPNGMTVVEELSDDTVVFHQVHKRVWPAAQRDSLFWSHMRQVPIDETDDENVYNTWVVVNHSTDVDAYPVSAWDEVGHRLMRKVTYFRAVRRQMPLVNTLEFI